MKWQQLVQLHPVARPTVGGDFFRLPGWKRSLVSIVYCVRCFEHWIAPQGWAREWLRLNVLAVVLMGTSILLVGPVISALLLSLFDWTDLSVQILIKIMSMAAVLPPFLLALTAGVFLWNVRRQRRGSRRSQNPNNGPYYE